MTTFQDPPPQSRRAVRQSERGETPGQVPAPQPYSFEQDSTAPQPTEAPETRETPPTGGHRAEPVAESAPGGFEPLNYMTQGRQPLPADLVASSTDADSRETPSSQLPAESSFRVRDYSPEGRRAAINREQFAAVSAPPPAAPRPTTAPAAEPTLTAPVDLEYFTQGLVPTRAPVSTPLISDDDPQNHTLTRRELRELRAAQEEPPPLQLPEPIDNILNSGPIDIPTLSVLPGHSQALADAMAEFDALTRNRRDLEPHEPVTQADLLAAAPPPIGQAPVVPVQVAVPAPVTPVVPVPVPTSQAQAYPFAAPPPAPADLVAPTPVVSTPVVSAQDGPPALVEPQLSPPPSDEPLLVSLEELAPSLAESTFTDPTYTQPAYTEPILEQPAAVDLPIETAPVNAAPVQSVPVPPPVDLPALNKPIFDELVAEQPAASADPVFLEPERAPSTRPVGHWSVQAELDDDELLENTVSRTVGAGSAAVTTSALVLPSVPQASDLMHPFTATGEILVTGSIDLPRSLGSTGAHPHRVDNSDFEDDPLDSQVVSTDSAPVRAIRAISTHTSTRGVIESKRPQGNRMPTIMIIAASVLALGVVGLLVAAAVLHLF